ncbi:uncharacterized protein C2orf80 [Menidia menidia]
MEAKRLQRDVEALIADYVGQRLREKSFDPAGRASSVLDELAHYDLAISVALWWLNREELKREEGQGGVDTGIIGAPYPSRLEREAMILSSFAGIIMSRLPVEEILDLYKRKPAACFLSPQTQVSIVHPFPRSCHPFAMLGSYRAAHHSRRLSQRLSRWRSERGKSGSAPRPGSLESRPPSWPRPPLSTEILMRKHLEWL